MIKSAQRAKSSDNSNGQTLCRRPNASIWIVLKKPPQKRRRIKRVIVIANDQIGPTRQIQRQLKWTNTVPPPQRLNLDRPQKTSAKTTTDQTRNCNRK